MLICNAGKLFIGNWLSFFCNYVKRRFSVTFLRNTACRTQQHIRKSEEGQKSNWSSLLHAILLIYCMPELLYIAMLSTLYFKQKCIKKIIIATPIIVHGKRYRSLCERIFPVFSNECAHRRFIRATSSLEKCVL